MKTTEGASPSRAPAVRRTTALGFETRYLEAGEGPPLLLLPSLFLGADPYGATIDALAGAGFRVLAAEQPDSGGSARPRTPLSYERTADWAAAFLDAVGVDRALAAGHSDAGAVCIHLGARHPGRLDGLVLCGAVGADPGATWASQLRGILSDGLTQEVEMGPKLGLPAVGNLLFHPRSWLHRAFRLCADSRSLAVAMRVPVPTLLAWGRNDSAVPPACAERYRVALPDARIYLSEGSHNWLIQRPDEYAAVVAAFAEELASRGSGPATGRRGAPSRAAP